MTTLKSAFSGEPFSYRGRTVRVTPAPYRPGGPAVLLGGSSEPAARRAARIADGFVPSVPEVWEHCRDEVARLGPPRPRPQPDRAEPGGRPRRGPRRGLGADGAVLPARDQRLRGLAAQDDVAAPFRTAEGLAELRRGEQYRVLAPERFVREPKAAPRPFTQFHPLCGGMPMESAWSSLRLFEREVLPAFG
ncbi:LLM class flavin-dependent oxidoreductase [Streptomyces galilaeus]